jgi:Fur family ferric uptake transcriptional regulator
MSKAEHILKEAGLRKTKVRIKVLERLVGNDHAMSHSEIEAGLDGVDRVTLYRTLKSFDGKGIIHKVIDGSGSDRFALCEHHCNEEHHHDDHIHFNCKTCGNTFCIDEVSVPYIKLPKQYKVHDTHILISGVCNGCNS